MGVGNFETTVWPACRSKCGGPGDADLSSRSGQAEGRRHRRRRRGATVAKYLAKDSNGGLDVTLVEDSETFTTCFFSNLYIGGFRDLSSITHSYEALTSAYGIKKVTGLAVSVDRDAKTVTMADGATLRYDRLILSPASTSSTSPCLDTPGTWKSRLPMPGRQDARPRSCARSSTL